MQNLSDQELDKRFRQAADQHRLPYEPEQWNRMAGRLAAAHKPFYAKWQTWVVAVTVVSVTTWLWWSTPSVKETPGLTLNQSIPSQALPDTADSGSLSFGDEQKGKSAVGSETVHQNSLASTFSDPVQRHPSNDFLVNANGQEKIHQSVGDTPLTDLPTEDLASTIKKQNHTRAMVPAPDDSVAETEVMKEETKIEMSDSTHEKSTRKMDSGGSAWYVKATFAPDYSTVAGSQPGQAGTNYGVLLGFQWASRWSVETGVLRSNKVYTASGGEYAGYPTDRLSGSCMMLDIPVNVYYRIGLGKRTRFFAGSGLSSYLMQEEDYVSYVDTPYGTEEYEWSVTGQNKEWLQVLNLSIGLEQQLSSQWSLQVEPFWKAPLAGVGEGDVALASFGAFFSLKYSFRK
jgi:hypothetical protein